jgi:hypothetical protein
VSTWATEDAAWRFRRPPFPARRFEKRPLAPIRAA